MSRFFRDTGLKKSHKKPLLYLFSYIPGLRTCTKIVFEDQSTVFIYALKITAHEKIVFRGLDHVTLLRATVVGTVQYSTVCSIIVVLTVRTLAD